MIHVYELVRLTKHFVQNPVKSSFSFINMCCGKLPAFVSLRKFAEGESNRQCQYVSKYKSRSVDGP